MKIKNTYILSEIDEENIVITIGDVEETFNGYLKLNETSKYLWKELEQGLSMEELISKFQTKYSIELERASNDVKEFLTVLREIKAIED